MFWNQIALCIVIAHIKSIEVEGDVQFIEELEVEVKNHMKFLNIFQHL
jgi:hypothetical protein